MSAITIANGVIFCIEYISLNNFETGPPKEHPRQVSSTVAQLFKTRCLLNKILTTHGHTDKRSTEEDHNSASCALCAHKS